MFKALDYASSFNSSHIFGNNQSLDDYLKEHASEFATELQETLSKSSSAKEKYLLLK